MKLSFTALAIGLTLSGSILSADSRPEPLADPIPEKIKMGEITVALDNFVRVPETEESASPVQTNSAYARIQYMTPLPDNSSRLVINDLRGIL